MNHDYTRRDFLKHAGLALLASMLPQSVFAAAGEERPNILVLMGDDWGYGHASVLGDPMVQTPVFDRLAREGVLFSRAYCASPSCTPSRASLLTGQMFYRLESGAHLWGSLDKKFVTYPEMLEAAGYAVGLTGKGSEPGDHRPGGRTQNPAGRRYRAVEDFFNNVKTDQPFCFWFGSSNPHRPYTEDAGVNSGMDLKKVVVPPFLPDSDMMRRDICDYYYEIQQFNREAECIIALLEKAGKLDNTIVVMTSDNGMPFPRAKCNLYDSGTRMPTVVRWGNKIKGGRVVDDYASLTDFAPTFLEAAGLPVPKDMTGRSLLSILQSGKSGRVEPTRDSVVVGRERHGASYPCRAIHTDDYLYIRNFHPERKLQSADSGRGLTYMKEHQNDPDVKPYWALYAAPRPTEELYDKRTDPHQLKNVGDNPAYAEIKKRMADRLNTYLTETNDPRAGANGDILDTYPDTRPKE